MRITILAIGTRGDIQPLVALGAAFDIGAYEFAAWWVYLPIMLKN